MSPEGGLDSTKLTLSTQVQGALPVGLMPYHTNDLAVVIQSGTIQTSQKLLKVIRGALVQDAAGLAVAHDAGIVDQHINGAPLVTHELSCRLPVANSSLGCLHVLWALREWY